MAALEARVARLEAAPRPATEAEAARIATIETHAAALGANDAALAERVDRIGRAVAAASGTAVEGERQMRDLLLVSIARRQVEAGRPLGPLVDLLRRRFGDRDAAAVEAIARWSAAPTTPVSLAARLDRLAEPMPAARTEGWWTRTLAAFRGMVAIRRPGEPVQEQFLADARGAIAAGDPLLAAARLEAMPPTPERAEWIADARGLAAARAALDRLEMMLLEAPLMDPAAGS
jgi:hypothetical protein